MRRVIPLIGVCLLLAAAAEPAFAQQRLFALTNKEIVEVDTNLSSLGRVIQRVPVPSDVGFTVSPSPVSLAGGSLLAWIADGKLVLFDTHRGSYQQFALLLGSLGDILGTSADSYTLLVRASTATSSAVAFIDVRHRTIRMLDLGANAGVAVYAPKSDVLFVRPLNDLLTSQVEVRRAANGALLKTLSVAPASPLAGLSVSAWGTRLFVDSGPGGTGLLAFDVASGALLAEAARGPFFLQAPILDEHRGRLLVRVARSSGSIIAALSIGTLQQIGIASLPPGPAFYDSALQVNVSDRSATIFALTTVFNRNEPRDPVCAPSTLAALHVDTGQLKRAVDLTSVTGTTSCFVRLVRVTEPAAPSGFSASVTGRSVSLSWGAEAATHYELEAGSGQGLANLARVRVDGTQLTVDNVPPGVYHLRVRAINTIGKSGASREVQVIVP